MIAPQLLVLHREFRLRCRKEFQDINQLGQSYGVPSLAAVFVPPEAGRHLPSRFKVSVSQGLAFRNWTNFAELVRRSKVLSARDS